MPKSLLPDAIDQYIDLTFVEEPESLKALRKETASMPEAGLQITPSQGRFLDLIVKLLAAKRALEVGVFTGYSGLCTLMALAEGGTLTALDISDEFTQLARKHWNLAGFENRYDLQIGPAVAAMDRLISAREIFDFCFIDADKPNYCGYFERAVQLVRPGGLIVVDNTLWHGRVADMDDLDERTVAIRQVNEMAAKDPRVEACMVPIGDGLLLSRRL